MTKFENVEMATKQAERTLKNWGMNLKIVKEMDGDNTLIGIWDKKVGFKVYFAVISPDGEMSIDLTPRIHAVLPVNSIAAETLSLMFALSALSNLLTHKTGWLQLSDDVCLSLAWDYSADNSFDVEVVATKLSSTSEMRFEVTLDLEENNATLKGVIYDDNQRSIDEMMRFLIGLVLAFVKNKNSPAVKGD